MKAKRQIRYVLDRTYLDCSTPLPSHFSFSLLLSVHSLRPPLLSDGINSISFTPKPSKKEGLIEGATYLFRDVKIDIEERGDLKTLLRGIDLEDEAKSEIEEEHGPGISLRLEYSDAKLVIPFNVGPACEPKDLASELTESEVEFLRNSLFEKNVRRGGKKEQKMIELDEMMETTSESVSVIKPLQKKVKTT